MSARLLLTATGLALAFAGCAKWVPHGAQHAPAAPVIAAPPVAAPIVPDAPVMSAPVSATVTPRRPQDEQFERLLIQFERLKRMRGAELAKEHEAARHAFARVSSDINRISYAMTLSLPGTSINDDGRALDLLHPVVTRDDADLHPLAVLLSTFLREQRRLGSNLATVQKKLNALRALERKLIERDRNNSGQK